MLREIEVAPLTSSDVKLDCARMVTVMWVDLQNDAVHMRGRRHGSVGQPRSAERRAERAAGDIQEQRRGDEGRIGERLEEPIRKGYINWAFTETARRIALYPQRLGCRASRLPGQIEKQHYI